MGIRAAVLLLGFSISVQVAAAPIAFEDTSDKLGFTRGTETWGIAWGDLNNDNWPDLWNSGHRDYPRLYRNTGTGDFDDVTRIYDQSINNYWFNNPVRDVHGGAWGDFDNDGDEDLITGDENELFINEVAQGGLLRQSNIATNQQYAAWNNLDNDRELESDTRCGGTRGDQYFLQFDVDADGDSDLVCAREGAVPSSVIGVPTDFIPRVGLANDTAIGDFNNDLRTDMVVTRGSVRPNGAGKVNSNRIEAWFVGRDREFTFSAPGQVTFLIDGGRVGVFALADRFELDTNGQTNALARGIEVSYDSSTQLWRVRQISGAQAYVRVIAQNTVSEPVLGGLRTADLPAFTAHGINTPSGFDWVFNTGLSGDRSCVSVVAADFDNDMDLDLYMACREGVSNLANKYFDNDGDGTFTEIINHGGEGPVGVGLEFGVADSVISADYDLDGFMDLAVSNGALFYPVSFGGPDTLIRNQGNANHWVELDLIGTVSPRAAIGAKVFLTAGGVTQLREQSGGYHRWSQNHSRIHFGLADNTVIDQIRVEWPSGQEDIYTNVSADNLYDVTENGAITPAVLGPDVTDQVEPGQECNQPPYTITLGPVLQIWRVCGTDNWRLRVRSGLARITEQRDLVLSGSIVGSSNFGPVAPASNTAGDIVDNSIRSRIDFQLTVQGDVVNNKGFNFNTNGQTSTCFFVDTGADDFEVVHLGDFGKRITLPYDLTGLSACVFDRDGDGIIDIIDDDDDNDGVLDVVDAFPFNPNESADSDGDGVGDNADAFPNDASETVDSDADGVGDNGDIDIDNDGITDAGEQIVIAPIDFNVVQNVSAYGNQDASQNVTISPDGSQITLRDNTWRRTINTYDITPNTVIEFDFQSDVEGELQAIGFISSTTTIDETEYFLLAGTQNTSAFQNFPYTNRGSVQHFTINVGDFYTGNNLNLVFVNDDDGGFGSDSSYSNVIIYERLGDPIDFNVVQNVSAYGSQDASQNVTISPDGSQITLRDNTWRRTIDTYDITPNTILEFDFQSDVEGELQAIGFISSTTRIDESEYFLLAGIQNTPAFQNFPYTNRGSIQHFVINVGDFYTGNNLNLVFVNDDDSGLGSDSSYSNVLVYEGAGGTFVRDDGDGVANENDLDSDNDGIADVVEVGLADADNDFIVDDLVNGQGTITSPVDSDGDGIPDFLDLESNNAANDGTNYDISGTANAAFDSNGDGTINGSDIGGGIDIDADGIDDLIDANTLAPGNGTAPPPPPPPPPPATDDSCGEPIFDRFTDQGFFLWRDCPTNNWTVRLSAGGAAVRTVAEGSIASSDDIVNLSEFSFEGNDILDGVSNPGSVDFELSAAGAGQDGFSFTPLGEACFIVDSNAPFFLGSNKVLTESPLNLDTLERCDVPVVAVDPPQCGEPVFDQTTEPGVFLWQDCSATSGSDDWFLRIAGGGLPFEFYSGSLTSTNLVAVEGTRLEPNDVIDSNLADNGLNFSLGVGGTAIDGLNIQIPSVSQTCFSIEQQPSLANVYVGRFRLLMNSAFNLEDLGVCL